jgi:hypothetical protein
MKKAIYYVLGFTFAVSVFVILGIMILHQLATQGGF